MLDKDAIHQCKRRIIDTLGCAIGGYGAQPCQIARDIAMRVRQESGALVFGTSHRTLPELAVFANGVMARYLDGNDTFPGGGGHPSDLISAVLAIADATGAHGSAAIAAIALAYEVYYAFFGGSHIFRDRGLDHAFFAAVSSAIGAAKLLGLDREKLANAVSLSITPNVALHATRRGNLSMWKGCAGGNAARNGVFAALLALAGMTGPENAIEGSDGLHQLIGNFAVGELAKASGTFAVTQSNLKYFLSEYHSQAPITVALRLSRQLRPEDIESVTIHTYWFTWSEIGSGPEKWHPTTRESADHSLPFIIAAVLIDREFSDAIFSEERLRDPQVHALADKVTVKEDPEFTRRFPSIIPCRIEIRTRTGDIKTDSVDYPRGHVKNPMSDEEVVVKFKNLASRVLAPEQIDSVLERAWDLEEAQNVRSLLEALHIH
jgi:2-methylcitrate dehydratase